MSAPQQHQPQPRKDLFAMKHCTLIITGLLAFCLGVPVVRADEVPPARRSPLPEVALAKSGGEVGFGHADWKASPTDPVGFAGDPGSEIAASSERRRPAGGAQSLPLCSNPQCLSRHSPLVNGADGSGKVGACRD